jgi:VWFA-related protein
MSTCRQRQRGSERRRRVTLAAAGLAALAGAVLLAGGQAQEPRFRGGTNLVRLDVYVSVDGTAVTDLAADDFEVLEDSTLQQVTSFELVRARGVVPDSARVESNTVAEARARAAQPDTRLFVLFLDTLHVQLEGSYHAQNPVAALLDRVVGEDDLVGVMTPDISARNVTFSPRTSSVGRMLSDNWTWGKRDAVTSADPREEDLKSCYPDADYPGVARALIDRRREQKTLAALEDLLNELERQREERTFVLLLTEGWTLPQRDERLARRLEAPGGRSTTPGGPEPIGPGPDGRLTAGRDSQDRGMQSCERERMLLALADLDMEFQRLTQRANRANVSFYPIDPRGLVVFDSPIGPDRPPGPVADAQILRRRQEALRTLAAETDGTVVLNTNIERALPRLLTDVGAYYLLGYISTNQKLDGRYRRLTVRVKRPGVTVRARPGYLAPTAAELSAAAPQTAAAGPPSSVSEALSRLPGGRTAPPMYLQAAGGAGYLQVVVEIDRATAALPEWQSGASIRVEFGPADATTTDRQVEEITLEAGKRTYAVRHPARDLLPPGRYQVRAEAKAATARVPLRLSTVVTVPDANALLGSAAVASRRGPGTGRLFEPSADPRYRRTERLLVETPLMASDAKLTARLLNRVGQPMAVPVTLAERLDESLQLRVAAAELALAPLAPGEYVVELVAAKGAATSTISYGFRIVP